MFSSRNKKENPRICSKPIHTKHSYLDLWFIRLIATNIYGLAAVRPSTVHFNLPGENSGRSR